MLREHYALRLLDATPLKHIQLAGDDEFEQADIRDIAAIREACGPDFQIVTPGIRPVDQQGKDDQARTLTPAEAMKAGSTYLVIGRPITGAPNPREAAEQIAAAL